MASSVAKFRLRINVALLYRPTCRLELIQVNEDGNRPITGSTQQWPEAGYAIERLCPACRKSTAATAQPGVYRGFGSEGSESPWKRRGTSTLRWRRAPRLPGTRLRTATLRPPSADCLPAEGGRSELPASGDHLMFEKNPPAMTENASKTQILLAWLAGLLVVALIVVGGVWHGVSSAAFRRLWQDILDRPGGPMRFRFILQPTMAAIAALHEGVKDARVGRSPFFWTVLSNHAGWRDRLHEGLISTARIILLGLAMDTIYQVMVLKTFYPAEAAIMAVVLAFFPYVLLRGPITRFARWRRHGTPADQVR
jgi:hypothetical protein